MEQIGYPIDTHRFNYVTGPILLSEIRQTYEGAEPYVVQVPQPRRMRLRDPWEMEEWLAGSYEIITDYVPKFTPEGTRRQLFKPQRVHP